MNDIENDFRMVGRPGCQRQDDPRCKDLNWLVVTGTWPFTMVISGYFCGYIWVI